MSLILKSLTSRWQSVIRRAKEEKRKHFGRQAEDAHRFYVEPDHSFLYSQAYLQNSLGLSASAGMGDPDVAFTYKATINLTSNVVQVFLPVLYHRNPSRMVTPRIFDMPDELVMQLQSIGAAVPTQPMMRQAEVLQLIAKSKLMNHYLNVTPRELNLKDHARLSVTEALIKGMGVLWVEAFPSTDGANLFGLAHDSIDFFNADPDSTLLGNAGWIMRERTEPIYQVERKFGLPPGTIVERGDIKLTSGEDATGLKMATEEPSSEAEGSSITCDTITYYEVWSRIGFGTNLKGAVSGAEFDEATQQAIEGFGDYVYLAIPSKSSGYPYPLNLPADLVENPPSPEANAAIMSRIQWPVPTYHDRSNPWPCVVLGFHPVPNKIWCHSHVTPVMGIQKAIDWIFSFMIGRIRITSRAFIVVPTDVEEEIKERILKGRDLELLEIELQHPGTQQKLVEFLKMPEVNGELWNLLMMLKKEFEDGTGVTELNLAGRTSHQMRSAKEAAVRQEMLSVRPDDMANLVENWMAAGARLEIAAAAALSSPLDVARVFGESDPMPTPQEMLAIDPMLPMEQSGFATQLWTNLISPQPLTRLFSEMEFTVESNSARKPNIDEMISNVDESAQILLPAFLQEYSQSGSPQQINAWIKLWGKSRNVVGVREFLFPDKQQQMMMMQMQAAHGGGGPGGSPDQGPDGQGGPPPSPEQAGPPIPPGQGGPPQ